ncbi:glutamate synthase subunit beta [Micromonospora chersina]|uniref:Glutamate synthase (NADH) small subunit n=1 Tax=Micromonospora chersina TaxID=47854 RepID=A0A1C6VY22_9ACTN|nr:glutamate synthase subunit beta [Micromonospora chersina]SCL71213.1 glutamate synthase (NADH) small subunit [Micromonospora chersina]
MPDPNGFLRYDRRLPARRPVPVRIMDWREVYPPAGEELIREQATRCMDCGIPFCHDGCPLGNRIPDWNDLVRTGGWDSAVESLHATNNFPEFTGRLCPAPCEAACVLGLGGQQPVTIKQVEVEIADAAVARGGLRPQPVPAPTGKSVAVVGSGPAGLAAAQQLARAGHAVTVYERDDALGGLLRYGIPDFKLEKRHIDRRLAQLAAEGVRFRTGVNVGVDVTAEELRAEHDAVLLACGALQGRDTPETPGRALRGVHQAMAHLVAANRVVAAAGEGRPALATLPDGTPIDAAGKHVVIIGGGDTAADCLGVAHRQGAAGVHQLDLYPEPPADRDAARDPWPTWPWVLRSYPAHEEGGERVFAVAVQEFVDDGTGQVRAVRIAEVTVEKVDGRRIVTALPGSEREIPADLVLLAIGFEGTEDQPLLAQFGVDRNGRGAVDARPDWQAGADGVFVAGDMHRGASLIVWAIAEGRAAAAAIHAYLGGVGTLPAPVDPARQPLAAR